MSSLVTTGPKNWTRPYAIYDGPRTGDAFMEYNMGQIQFVDPPVDLDVLYGLADLRDNGQINQLFGAATQMFGDSVESIEFRSQVTPPIIVNKPFTSTGQRPEAQIQGGTPFTAIVLDKFAKPAAYVHLKGGAVYAIEPYGRPTDDYTGWIVGGAGIAVGVGLLVGITVGKKLFC